MTTSEREIVANSISDEIVELMNRQSKAGAPTDAIFMGLLLGLLSFGASVPRWRPAPALALFASAEMCNLSLGGRPIPEKEPVRT